MKRFKFQLETVLDYKQQALDALMVEHGAAQEQVRRQTALRDEASARLQSYDEECAQKRARGITALEALEFQACLQTLEKNLRVAEEELLRLQKLEEAKRLRVVEARKESFSLEKLREIRKTEYAAAVRKDEETMIDELTASRRRVSNA